MQHDFSDRGKTRRVGERASQMLGDGVQALCRRPLFILAEEKAPCEIAKDESARCPVTLEDQDDGWIGLPGETYKCPVAIGRPPDLDSNTRSGAHAIEGMRPAVGVNGN
jgi:hypothetical protein